MVAGVNAQSTDALSDQQKSYLPSRTPDRIILNLSDSPLATLNVNWRTSVDQQLGKVEWAEAMHSTAFLENVVSVEANSEFLSVVHETNPTIDAYYHAAQMSGLEPGKTYVYRVGLDDNWSEWFQGTLPNPEADGISFIYLGDAQNGVRDHWSRLIRQAYNR